MSLALSFLRCFRYALKAELSPGRLFATWATLQRVAGVFVGLRSVAGPTRRRDQATPGDTNEDLEKSKRAALPTIHAARLISRRARYNFGVSAISDNIDKFSGYRYTSDRFITATRQSA